MTVTGQQQCDHIIGFVLSNFPQYQERDRLARASDNEFFDNYEQVFKYCPLCGEALPHALACSTGFSLKQPILP